MTLKNIKKLVSLVYLTNNLDEKKINLIAKNLSRSDLKKFIKQLKLSISKQTVEVYISNISFKKDVLSSVSKTFPDKQIKILEDKELIGGIKIVNYDMVYEDNLKNTLNNMVSYITN